MNPRHWAAALLASTLLVSGCQQAPAPGPAPPDPTGEFVLANASAGLAHVVGGALDVQTNEEMMETVTGGLALGDADGDGWVDLYVADAGANALYFNRGDGTFEEATEAAGVQDMGDGGAALFADLDNDGRQDLFLVNFLSGHRLFRNLGDGTFANVTEAAGVGDVSAGVGAAAADIDLDGDLDVVVANYGNYRADVPTHWADSDNGEPNLLYVNRGDGTFTRTELERSEAPGRWTFAVAFGDYDRDGDDDLYESNDFGWDRLWRNDAGVLTDVTDEAHAYSDRNGMAAVWADLDGDAWLDMFVSNIHIPNSTHVPAFRGNVVFRNLGDGTFDDVGQTWGLADAGWAWGAAAFDADHDTDLDVFVANGMITVGPFDLHYDGWFNLTNSSEKTRAALEYNETHGLTYGYNLDGSGISSAKDASIGGHQANRFFLNQADGFVERGADVGLGLIEDARAAAVSDVDRDGDQDLFVGAFDKPVHLLVNRLAEGNWLALTLEGTQSNRDAVGAWVEAEVDGSVMIRQRTAGSGFMSQHGPEVHFGLGASPVVDTLTVRWPSGHVQTFDGLVANHRYHLLEEADRPALVE